MPKRDNIYRHFETPAETPSVRLMREADKDLRVTRRERKWILLAIVAESVCACIGNNLKERWEGEKALIPLYGAGVESSWTFELEQPVLYPSSYLLADCEVCKGRTYSLGNIFS